jgi:hypothetical protein
MTEMHRGGKAKRPQFPSEQEIRQALLESGMSPLAVEREVSQLLHLLGLDFFGRRKRRLYEVVAIRIGVVQLMEKLVAVVHRHEQETGNPLNVDDIFYGPYKYLLTDFGPRDVDGVIKELERQQVLRQEDRAGIQVLRPTKKHFHSSATALRRILDQMKLHLGIRYAADYDTEKTYRV